MTNRLLVLVSADALVSRALARLDFTVVTDDAAGVDTDTPVVVVDLDAPGALDAIAGWRSAKPNAFIGAHSAIPDRSAWDAAERAGADFVTNRGAFATQLGARLPPEGAARRTRTPLLDVADLAGRLGVVLRRDDTPVGPVALYQVAGGISVLGDRCPHARACVSEGELEGTVVTCPRHGSRFDVRTGARLRGPADDPLPCYEVADDGGVLYLVS